MSKEKTRSVLVAVPTSQVDVLSFQLWELGIAGLQELPSDGELYIPQAGSEFREPQSPSDWTRDEKLIEGATTRLKIFFEDSETKSRLFTDFFTAHSVKVIESLVIDPQSYLETYKTTIQGKNFGDGLWVGPPWVETVASDRKIIIEPGMAFGTGEHPTTQMALESIWSLRTDAPPTILDIGSGSGVLAIACAKWLPSARIVATDIDPYAKNEIAKNLAHNGVAPRRVDLRIGDEAGLARLVDARESFAWVVSNIYGEVLARLTPQINALLDDNATWIATGVLDGPSRQVFESAIQNYFRIKKLSERRDSPPNESHLWLCYELSK